MAQVAVSEDPLAGLDEARLERLARLAGHLLRGRPLHHGGRLIHPRSAAGGLEFVDHRAMMPGDDPRHLDWRASARSIQPLVRRYRDERAGEWLLCLDRSASMAAAEGVWPMAQRLTAALGFLLLNLEQRVGLALFSEGLDELLPPGRGRAGYIALRRILVSTTPRSSGGASRLESCLPLLRSHRQAAVISDFLRPDGLRGALNGVIHRCDLVHVLRVTSAAGPRLPDGPLVVEDVESAERLSIRADAGLEDRLTARHTALGRDLELFCRRRGAVCSTSRADASWERVLLDHLVRPEARLA
jgi:uncharacterized protein (DUF58 family)